MAAGVIVSFGEESEYIGRVIRMLQVGYVAPRSGAFTFLPNTQWVKGTRRQGPLWIYSYPQWHLAAEWQNPQLLFCSGPRRRRRMERRRIFGAPGDWCSFQDPWRIFAVSDTKIPPLRTLGSLSTSWFLVSGCSSPSLFCPILNG